MGRRAVALHSTCPQSASFEPFAAQLKAALQETWQSDENFDFLVTTRAWAFTRLLPKRPKNSSIRW
jgi:hypothetical protein